MLPLLLLTFELFTGVPGQNVQWAGTLTDWQDRPIRMQETAPGRYRLQLEEPWAETVDYKFVVDGAWMADPSNPTRVPDGWGGHNSRVRTGFTDDPWLRAMPGSRPWRRDVVQGDVVVLSPPDDRPSVTVYFQDGRDYLEQGGITELVANLGAHDSSLPAITAVLIPAHDRMRQYTPGDPEGDRYIERVARELVPLVERRWPRTGGSRERRLLIGPSLGGLITLATALRHPDVFGLAASQSGSIWYREPLMLDLLRRAGPLKPRLWLDAGTYEPADDMAEPNRRWVAQARAAGFDVIYKEYPSRHDWTAWRNRLRETLTTFLR
jgi:enterochelin esterase family protein